MSARCPWSGRYVGGAEVTGKPEPCPQCGTVVNNVNGWLDRHNPPPGRYDELLARGPA